MMIFLSHSVSSRSDEWARILFRLMMMTLMLLVVTALSCSFYDNVFLFFLFLACQPKFFQRHRVFVKCSDTLFLRIWCRPLVSFFWWSYIFCSFRPFGADSMRWLFFLKKKRTTLFYTKITFPLHLLLPSLTKTTFLQFYVGIFLRVWGPSDLAKQFCEVKAANRMLRRKRNSGVRFERDLLEELAKRYSFCGPNNNYGPGNRDRLSCKRRMEKERIEE